MFVWFLKFQKFKNTVLYEKTFLNDAIKEMLATKTNSDALWSSSFYLPSFSFT